MKQLHKPHKNILIECLGIELYSENSSTLPCITMLDSKSMVFFSIKLYTLL